MAFELLNKGLPSLGRRYARAIADAANEHGINPWILAGVIDRESGFGRWLDKDGKGDGGNGHGLAQIDIGTWSAWLKSNDWRDPTTNIRKGAEILAAELKTFGGDYTKALAAYNAGPKRVQAAVKAGRHPDSVTTGGDYATDVLRRAAAFYSASAKATA